MLGGWQPFILIDEDVFAIPNSPNGSFFYDVSANEDVFPRKGSATLLCSENVPFWKEFFLEKLIKQRVFVLK